MSRNSSTPILDRGATVSAYEVIDRRNASTQLTSCNYQLAADDFKPGFHLEVGELDKRRKCPSGRLEGTTATSLPEPERESSVDPRYGSEFLSTDSGMSGYPAPHIQSRNGRGPRPK